MASSLKTNPGYEYPGLQVPGICRTAQEAGEWQKSLVQRYHSHFSQRLWIYLTILILAVQILQLELTGFPA